jgi:hypothetical protein
VQRPVGTADFCRRRELSRPMSDSASDKFPSATQLRWTAALAAAPQRADAFRSLLARPVLCAQLMSARSGSTHELWLILLI